MPSAVLLLVLALLLALVIAHVLLPVPVLVVPPALYQFQVCSLQALYWLTVSSPVDLRQLVTGSLPAPALDV